MTSLLIQAVSVVLPPLIYYLATRSLWQAATLALGLALLVSAIQTVLALRRIAGGTRRTAAYVFLVTAVCAAAIPWVVGTLDESGRAGDTPAIARRVSFHSMVLQILHQHYRLPQMFAYCARRDRENHEPFARAARRFLAGKTMTGDPVLDRLLEAEILGGPDTELLIRFRGKQWGDVDGSPPRYRPLSPQPAALVHIDPMGIRYVVEQ